VIILDGEAIGPFKSREDAESYRASDWENHRMAILDLHRPARNWRRAKLVA